MMLLMQNLNDAPKRLNAYNYTGIFCLSSKFLRGNVSSFHTFS